MNDLKGIIEDCNKSDLVSDKIIKKIIEIIGQEEWQDLHDENNDICTTMGELIITLNGVADLEKENALLKGRNEGFEQQIMGLLIKYEEVYKRFPDLKSAMDKAQTILKENAELKAELKAIDEAGEHGRKQITESFRNKKPYWELEKQLTKAKEIIKKLIEAIHIWDCKNLEQVEAEAEQFLKEESTTSNECHDCAKFDEMPKGPRCKTCDNGSHFQKKEEA